MPKPHVEETLKSYHRRITIHHDVRPAHAPRHSATPAIEGVFGWLSKKGVLLRYEFLLAEQIYLQPFRKTKLQRELYVNLFDVPNFFLFFKSSPKQGFV
jgi:hypothetical protein